MAIYAVYSPALDRDPVAAFDSARVLRQGFSRWAFVLGPFWLLFKGLWLALAGWAAGAALVGLAVGEGVLSSNAAAWLYWLAALYLGLEGRTLQAAALTRNGRPLADIVGAPAIEDAERTLLARALAAKPSVPSNVRSGPPPSPDSAIIGLFPEAGV